MPGGFLDGLNGAVASQGIDSSLRACVFTTPAHAQAPDVDAALRLLAAGDRVYDPGLDTGPPEEFADAVGQYYEELAARLETVREESGVMPEDRMYL